jgi:prepilin-type N-terminal cleavage/methylation domain-containing protein
MKNNRAFTLIEVMVVLSILTIIAILAYNFFGSTMKEAAEKQKSVEIYRALNVLADGFDLYYAKNGTETTFWPDLLTDGIIKSNPSITVGAVTTTGGANLKIGED